METTPIPTPPIIRYTTNCVKSVQRAHPKADAEKRIAEITIVNFLPNLSLKIPAKRPPMIDRPTHTLHTIPAAMHPVEKAE